MFPGAAVAQYKGAMPLFFPMPAYYLVRSREELKRELGAEVEFPSRGQNERSQGLVEPSIWTTPRWQSSAYPSERSQLQADSLKLTFLADLCTAVDAPEWLTEFLESDRPRAERLRALLSRRPHSTQTFDQWWTLEYLGLSCERSETEVFSQLPMKSLLEAVTSEGSTEAEFWRSQISKQREVPAPLLAGFRWLVSWVRKELAPRKMFISARLAEHTDHMMALASVDVERWRQAEGCEAGDVSMHLTTCEWYLDKLNLTFSVSSIRPGKGARRIRPSPVADVTMEIDSTATVIGAVVTRSERVV